MVMLMCENETCITKFDTNNMHACYPCCSIECFREWENDLNHKVVRHSKTAIDKSWEKMRELTGIQCQGCKSVSCLCKAIDAFCDDQNRIREQKMAAKEIEFERFRAIVGMERQKQDAVVDSGIKTPLLKDFIGKECNIFGISSEDDSPEWKSGVTLSNLEHKGNLETHHFIYMGSDDSCHIIQRKIDGEPDGIFFFPKAAVALRF